ncbi:XRE family transcriptional regulator [Streptomyces griseocarneus]|nr:XRE family transcriptional regulator [Streptomyces griseocarneus]
MDPFTITMAVVLPAVGSVTSDAVSGAAGEAGRRMAERLASLTRRMRGRGRAGAPPVVPSDPEARRALAAALVDEAADDPEFAREFTTWLREAELLRATAPALATTAARPRLLPPGTAVFTDREPERQALTALLDVPDAAADGAPRVVVLTGPGGVGKSATAVHFARAFADRFPDGQLYADLDGEDPERAVTLSGVLVRFLHALGVPPDRVPPDEQGQLDLYRDRTAGLRLVVVLDNVGPAGWADRLVTAAPGSLTLVTSRHALPALVGRGARVLRLGPLGDEDALLLLTRIAGPEPVGEQRAYAEAVAARCGGLPLALCGAGARVAGEDEVDWAALEREFATLEPGGTGTTDPAYLAADVAYRALAPDAARLCRLLAAWPWPSVPVGVAAAVAGTGEDEARRLLAGLAAARLLEQVADERYRFHDLVRRHAERQARVEDGRTGTREAVRRTVEWYMAFAAAADKAVIPLRWRLGPAFTRLAPRPGDGAAAVDALRREREGLAEAVRAADAHGWDDLVWQLCEAMWGFHLRLGFHEQWVDTHLRGVAAAVRLGDRRAEGRMRTQLAFAFMGLRRFADAERELTAAAEADRLAGHHRGRASATEALGLLCLRQWRYEDAEEHFRHARLILRAIGPDDEGAQDVPRALALLEHHLGRALRGRRLFTDAVEQLGRALACFEELGDAYNAGRVRMSLGETLLDSGDPEAACAPLDQALTTMRREGAELQLAYTAELRADCSAGLGDRAGELHFLRLARSLYGKAGDEGGTARMGARLSGRGA